MSVGGFALLLGMSWTSLVYGQEGKDLPGGELRQLHQEAEKGDAATQRFAQTKLGWIFETG